MAVGCRILRRLRPERNERAQPLITQEKPSPNQHAGNNGRKKSLAPAHKGRGRTAEITRQQNRAKNGGARNRIDDSADKFEDTDWEYEALGISKPDEALH